MQADELVSLSRTKQPSYALLFTLMQLTEASQEARALVVNSGCKLLLIICQMERFRETYQQKASESMIQIVFAV